MIIKHFLLWLPMIVIAFINATLRQLVFVKHVSELKAHQLSTITLIILCSLYVWIIFPFLNIQNAKQALLTGLLWTILTITFEFTLGRLTSKSWSYLLEDYNVITGHIWLLFIIYLFLLPYLFFIIRK